MTQTTIETRRLSSGYWEATISLPYTDLAGRYVQTGRHFHDEQEAQDWAEWMLDFLTTPVALAAERKPVESRGGVPTVHGDRCDAGVHAAVSQTYISGERAEESLLRIRRWLKEPRGWWTSQDEESYAAALSEARTEGGESE